MDVSLKQGINARLCSAHDPVMDVAKAVVQRPQDVQVACSYGLKVAARLEHVHAGFAIRKVILNAFVLPLNKFRRCTEEQDNAGGKCPVTVQG